MSKCPHPRIETKLSEAVPMENKEGDEDEQWVAYLGFIERCAVCHELLGDGYGDPWFYKTKEEAEKKIEGARKVWSEWREDADTRVFCDQCRKEEYVNFGDCLRTGWPMCHGRTMKIDYTDASIEDEVMLMIKENKRIGVIVQ